MDSLYTKILVDPRHTRITRIIYEPIARRFFSDSSMSFAPLSGKDLATAIEENNAAGVEDQLTLLDEGRAKRLLRAFSQGSWRARLEAGSRERQTTS